MHTRAWLEIIPDWIAVAWRAGRPDLMASLFDAVEEMSYIMWCEAGLPPELWHAPSSV